MIGWQMGASGEQLLAQRASGAVGGRIGAAPLQLRDQKIDNVLGRLVRHRIGEIVAVDVRLFGPLLQNVRDRRRRPDKDGPKTADATPARKLLDRPVFAAPGQMIDYSSNLACALASVSSTITVQRL